MAILDALNDRAKLTLSDIICILFRPLLHNIKNLHRRQVDLGIAGLLAVRAPGSEPPLLVFGQHQVLNVFQLATNLQIEFYHRKFFITLILMGKPKHIAPILIKSLNEQLSALDQEEKKINASADSKKQKLVFVNLREHLYSPDKQR